MPNEENLQTTCDNSRNCALIAAKAADSKKAKDIVVQEVGPFIGICDYFVMATGANPRQVDAIIEEIEKNMREKASLKPLSCELAKDSSWSLLDFGNVIVHVFMPEAREFYCLEQLWPDAKTIDLTLEEGFENLE